MGSSPGPLTLQATALATRSWLLRLGFGIIFRSCNLNISECNPQRNQLWMKDVGDREKFVGAKVMAAAPLKPFSRWEKENVKEERECVCVCLRVFERVRERKAVEQLKWQKRAITMFNSSEMNAGGFFCCSHRNLQKNRFLDLRLVSRWFWR